MPGRFFSEECVKFLRVRKQIRNVFISAFAQVSSDEVSWNSDSGEDDRDHQGNDDDVQEVPVPSTK